MSTRVVKNSLYLVIALVGQKLLAFVYFTILARSLHVEEIGLYSVAVSLSLVFSIFVDLGLTSVLIRDIAAIRSRGGNRQTEEHALIGNTLGLKILCALCAYGILYVGVRMAGYPLSVIRLAPLAGIIMILDSVQLTLYGVLRAYGNLRFEAYGMVMGQICALTIGSIFLWRHAPLAWFLCALIVGSGFNVLWSAAILRVRYHVPLTIRFKSSTMRALLISAAPFALAGIFVKIYSFVDSLLLARMAGVHAVGLYSIPYKLAFAFQFFPLAIIAALYPAMSAAYTENRAELKQLFEKSIVYIGMIATLIAVVLVVIASPAIQLLYGAAYVPGANALRVLAITLIFTFSGYPVGSLLNASRHQNVQTTFIGITAALNIALNIVLIPRIGILGAAAAALISNIFLTCGGFFYLPRYIGAPSVFCTASIGKIFVSGAVAILCGWVSTRALAPLSHLPFGAALYVAALAGVTALVCVSILFVTGVLHRALIQEIIQLFQRNKKGFAEPVAVESSQE